MKLVNRKRIGAILIMWLSLHIMHCTPLRMVEEEVNPKKDNNALTKLLPLALVASSNSTTGNQRFNLLWSKGSNGTTNGNFRDPRDVAVSSENFLYVADTGNCRIQKFDLDGNYISKWGVCGAGDSSDFKSPTNIAIDSNNNLYITDDGYIKKYSKDGVYIKRWGGWATYNWGGAEDIAIDKNDNVYVINYYNSRIEVYDKNGNYLKSIGSGGNLENQFSGIKGINIDSSFMYITDTGNSAIKIFNIDGTFISYFGSKATKDEEGKFDMLGKITSYKNNLYVTNTYFYGPGGDMSKYDVVQVFDKSGKFIYQYKLFSPVSAWAAGYPAGLTVDSKGNLYVVEWIYDKLYKFDNITW